MLLVPVIVAQAASLAVTGVTSLLKKLDPTAFIAVFLFALAPLLMRLEGRRSDRGAATI